jgi:transposase
MEVVHPRCAGLDVHKRIIVACRLTPGPRGHPIRDVESFRTTTRGLLELSDWLGAVGVSVVAMESTGSFWKPVYNVLEGSFELLVVNAQHLKAVPGRKTDVRDAEWIADLLRHGLLRPSFIPDRPERELRELTRYRTTLLQQRTAEVNRIQKVLEGANIKLASVASDVVGTSGRAMLEALVGGEVDPETMAALARAGCATSTTPSSRRSRAGLVRTSASCWRPSSGTSTRSTGWSPRYRPRSRHGCALSRPRSCGSRRSRASAAGRPRRSCPRSALT